MSDIAIIGGIAVDIEGHPRERLIYADSNPGRIMISYGGVSRNITENLARMGASVSFCSVAGNDFVGRAAAEQLQLLGVDISGVELLDGESTAIYLSILDNRGDMELALCNMDILERIDRDFMERSAVKAGGAKIVGIDTNMTEENIDYITDKLSGTPIFIDPVSVHKAERIKRLSGRFHTMKPNRLEAEAISGIAIASESDLPRAADWFLEAGVKRLFITLGKQGVFFADEKNSGILRAPQIDIVSATGAGDAFSAACLKAFVDGLGIRETAALAMAASAVAMTAPTAVSTEMSMALLKTKCENAFLYESVV